MQMEALKGPARGRKPPPGNVSKFGRKMRKNLRNAILPKNQKNTAPGAP